jgi:hypothetical protein
MLNFDELQAKEHLTDESLDKVREAIQVAVPFDRTQVLTVGSAVMADQILRGGDRSTIDEALEQLAAIRDEWDDDEPEYERVLWHIEAFTSLRSLLYPEES